MLRKIYLAVDCATEEEKEQVQDIFRELSGMQIVTGRQLLAMWPMFKRKQNDLIGLFRTIASEGGGAGKAVKIAGKIANLIR